MRISDWSSDVCSSDLSRRLEREAQRNIEVMWLTGRLTPDFKTIADFRRNNGAGIRNVCKQFIAMCRQLKVFSQAIVAIDGSKFKAVNSCDRNVTPNKIDRRQEQIDQSIQRYLDARSEEHTSELQSLMRLTYAVFCLKTKQEQH